MSYSVVKSVLFAIVFLGGLGLFAHSVWRMARLARLGQDTRGFVSDIVERIGAVVYLAFMQRRVVNEKFGWNHVIFFWGFMIITVGHIEFLVRGVFRDFSLAFVGKPIYSAILFGEDTLAFIVLFAVAAALFRRLVVKPNYIHISAEGFFILSLIAGVMITYFLAMGFGIAGHHPDMLHPDLPVSQVVAGAMSGVDPDVAWYGYEIFWWAHALILLLFLNVIPHSKHIHLLGAIPNIFLHKREKHKAALTRIDFETAETYGVSKVHEFSWKGLLDTYACTECGRCDMYCPARNTGKVLEPQQLIHDIRANLYANGDKLLAERPVFDFTKAPEDWEPELPLIAESHEARQAGQTSPEVLWGCTNCGACVQACPVLIDHVDAIMDMRRHLTLMEGNVQPELATTFQNIERNYNPWGIGADQRGDWAEKIGLKLWDQSEPEADGAPAFEYLFWVGCAGSYDNRSQKTVKAFTEILNLAGIQYAVLGQKEKCTGDPARRGGNEYLFDQLATENVQTLNDLGVKKVITTCPHCFNTLKNEYPAFGGNYDVVHHTQLIDKLIQEGRIKLDEEVAKKVTYHDPCFMSRWNDEVDAPRRSLAAVKRLNVVEMKAHGKKSFCCGAGGAQMWQEEQNENRVNNERVRQALETGADAIAVGCPFCMTMISDGVKAHDAEEKVSVVDVAEVVLDAMKAQHQKDASTAAEPQAESPA
jgi:Fe-S oxidoreductase